MKYDLNSLRPSQERRLPQALMTADGRAEFESKLRSFLSDDLNGGEGERDHVMSIARRLTALDVWSFFPRDHFRGWALRSDPARVEAFCSGLPKSIADSLARIPIAVPRKGGKRDQLILKYAEDLRNKCHLEPDMELLKKVTIACGPSIYQSDASRVAASEKSELERIKDNFLIRRLHLSDGPELMELINSAIERYGRSERNKYRAVLYYLLAENLYSGTQRNLRARAHDTERRSQILQLLS